MEEKKGTLYLNMILKEDEPVEMVQRSLNSVKDYVDGMYITITYSDIKPPDSHPLVILLTEYKAQISYFKWIKNFAKARQFALDQVPKDKLTFIYWQDADDILKGAENLPTIVADMVKYNQAAAYFEYLYMVETDKEGNITEVIIKHKRERVIRNDDTWHWVGNLHETLIEQQVENMIRIGRPECTVIHLSTPDRGTVALARNIEILEKQAREEQYKDPRTIVYLARAYFDKGKVSKDEEQKKMFNSAIILFNRYLEGSGVPGEMGYREASGWRQERATVWSHIGEIAILQKQYDVAVQAFQSAIDEGFEFPSYYIDLAMAYVFKRDYARASHWLNVATAVPEPETTIITYPKQMKIRALQVSLDINMHNQKLELARQDAEMLLQINPEDESAKNNLDVIKGLIQFNRACQAVVVLGKYLEVYDEKDKLAHLVQAIPKDMQQEKFATEMKHLFMPARIWGDREVAILCGPGFEKWSPNSLKTGIGGSEEAVIYMAREWAKLGWQVTVYGDPQNEAGNYDGVEYRPWYEINPKDSFNALILWRGVGFIDMNPKAKFTMLWMHDVPNNPDFTKERIDKIDKIAVLSEFHKSLFRQNQNGIYSRIPDSKFFVTANGIPLIDLSWKGDSKRLVYASSPDRGLVYLLMNWDTIRKEIPDAQLHIFYGFDVFDALNRDNPAKLKWKEDMMKMMNQEGIVYHGRVGHEALQYEFSKSGVWAYPCSFEEISCISAMKAQACGAIPVVTDYAALTETVRNGLRVDVDITTKEGQKEYVDTLISLLKDEKKQKEMREPMMTWAREYFLWSNVAKLWIEQFEVNVQHPEKKLLIKDIKEVKDNAISGTSK